MQERELKKNVIKNAQYPPEHQVVVRLCGHAVVVGGASSSPVRLLATIAVHCCFSSLDDDRSSLLGSRSSSSSIRSFVRIAIVHCVSSSGDDRSVSRVVRHRLFVGRRRLGVVSCRLLSRLCRHSGVVASHSLCVIACPSLIYLLLSLYRNKFGKLPL